MDFKIRQYISPNKPLPMAKVFGQNVDTKPSGFGNQLRLIWRV
jgi:hypothetical protein